MLDRVNRERAVIALGMFDGVHMGHRAILQRTVEQAKEQSALPVAVSFKTHPQALLGRAVPLLTLPDERADLFRSLGLEPLILDFDAALAHLPPEEFIDCLESYYQISGMVVGYNNRFGYKAQGDTDVLKKIGQERGFAVDVVDAVTWRDESVSSSRIRVALEEGRLAEANHMLVHPYFYRGIVRQHRQIGRSIGFPTLNIRPGDKLIPCRGVYASRVKQGLALPVAEETLWNGVTHIGNNPTVTDKKDIYIESNVMTDLPEMYGEAIYVELLSFIRPQVKFASLEEMRLQIAEDRKASLRFLQGEERAR